MKHNLTCIGSSGAGDTGQPMTIWLSHQSDKPTVNIIPCIIWQSSLGKQIKTVAKSLKLKLKFNSEELHHKCDQIMRFFALWATIQIILPKSPTLLCNFCEGVKNIFGQFLYTFGDFYPVTLIIIIFTR